MRSRITSALLDAAATTLASLYLLALIPVSLFGVGANAEYNGRGCPGAMQCSDASLVRTFAVIYIFSAPVIWLLYKLLRAAARAFRPEPNEIPALFE